MLCFIPWASERQSCLSQAFHMVRRTCTNSWLPGPGNQPETKTFDLLRSFLGVCPVGLCVCSPYPLPQSLEKILIPNSPPQLLLGALGILLNSAACDFLPRCPHGGRPCAPLTCRRPLHSFRGVHSHFPSELPVRQDRHQSPKQPAAGQHMADQVLSAPLSPVRKPGLGYFLPPALPHAKEGVRQAT